MKSVPLFLRLARPLFLLGGILLYALGGGIARYLGVFIDWGVYFTGQAWVTLMQLSAQFLNEYYNAPADQDNRNRTPLTGGSGVFVDGHLSRRVALAAAFVCLAGVASLTVLMLAQGLLNPLVMLIMVLAFLGAVFYSTPPVSLESSGYGELTTSILVSFLVPLFAFVLQTGEIHRLLAMSSFPLTVAHLAMLLAFQFPDYATDLKHNKRTLLVRMGWQNGMFVHNVLILTSFLVLALAGLQGLPWFAAFPAFLALPVGLLQIWQMRRIAGGSKPNWTALTINGLALFTVMAYFLTFAFWTN